MAKLIIGASADYSGLSLFNIDTIKFTRRADATFQSIQFGSNRIEDDVHIEGSSGVNRIIVNSGIGGFDASGWTFSFWQAQDRVVINGSSWSEKLKGSDRNDRIFGNEGRDTIAGGAGDDLISGGSGPDDLKGGAGNDTLSYAQDTIGVRVDLGKNEASRGEAAGDSIGGFENVTGGKGSDELTGGNTANRMTGGGGADVLEGNGGADRFIYRSVSDSTSAQPDVIVDFGGNDRIDLSAIDARKGPGNNQFRFIGTDDFETAGELRYSYGLDRTVIQADTDGDGVADIEIILEGRVDLNAGDFIL
jgi:Ca2+-binding RTX toxin-like protein